MSKNVNHMETIWQSIDAAEFLAVFLVLAGGIALIVFGVPMIAAVLGVE